MANLNKWYGIGRLTQDPDVRHTPRGNQIVTLTLAINRDMKDAQGNKQQETCFIDVTCMGKLGEIAAQYLSRGRECMVEGRLRMQQWTDKATGQNRSRLDVVAENLQFLGGGAPTGQQQGNQRQNTQQRSGNNYQQGHNPYHEEEEDIAF